jgi:hypothetical protein
LREASEKLRYACDRRSLINTYLFKPGITPAPVATVPYPPAGAGADGFFGGTPPLFAPCLAASLAFQAVRMASLRDSSYESERIQPQGDEEKLTASISTPSFILIIIFSRIFLWFACGLSLRILRIFQVERSVSQHTSTIRLSYCSPLSFNLGRQCLAALVGEEGV